LYILINEKAGDILSSKIIDPHRYKKTTRSKAKLKKEQKEKYMNKRKSSSIKYQKRRMKQARLQSSKKEVDVLLNGTEKKVKNKTKIYIPNFLKVMGAIFGIALIALISQRIIRLEESPIIHVFSNKEEEVKFKKDYELKIGISHLDTTNMLTSKNIILKELEKLTSVQLVSINQDNSLTYLAAKEIIKLSNTELH